MSVYVNMVDKFLSGWGKASSGRSLLSVECDSREQAEAIRKAAQDRPEMRYVTLSNAPPRLRRGDVLSRRRFEDLGGSWLAYLSVRG